MPGTAVAMSKRSVISQASGSPALRSGPFDDDRGDYRVLILRLRPDSRRSGGKPDDQQQREARQRQRLSSRMSVSTIPGAQLAIAGAGFPAPAPPNQPWARLRSF